MPDRPMLPHLPVHAALKSATLVGRSQELLALDAGVDGAPFRDWFRSRDPTIRTNGYGATRTSLQLDPSGLVTDQGVGVEP
jgi:hypothetical protein